MFRPESSARRAAIRSEVRLSVHDVRPESPAPLTREESQLVARIRAGDESAFETLYLHVHQSLWRFAYGLVRSRDVAEEIVQEVFLSLWRDRERWVVTVSPRAWLYGAVRNRALNHLRHEQVVANLATRAAESAVDDDGALMLLAGTPPADAQARVEAAELEAAVARAISSLPERRRVAMTLRWKHDLTAAEIAVALETTPEAVRVILTRARQELATLLGRVRR